MSKKKPSKQDCDKLDWAAYEGDLKTVTRLLKKGVSPNIGDSECHTPLRLAADRGHLEVVRVLLEHGADPNLCDVNGTPPLQLAVHQSCVQGGKPEHPTIVTLLLEKGADPDHANKWGMTPRKMARHGDAALKKLFPKTKRKAPKDEWKSRQAPTWNEFHKIPIPVTFWTEHGRLWDELVPPSGPAKTVQGEVIRITGKLTREAYRNGNMNWDKQCGILWRFVARTLDDPGTFTPDERQKIKEWVKEIIRDQRCPDCDPETSPYKKVSEKAVQWVLAHPKKIKHTPDPRVTW